MRKSLCSPYEDDKLKTYVAQHGYGNWSDVAKHAGNHYTLFWCQYKICNIFQVPNDNLENNNILFIKVKLRI